MFTITKGKLEKPLKVVLYAPEGIGKSTFASQFPDPLFIDTEGSTTHLDVNRLPKPTSWTMLIEEIKYVKENPTVCRTLVIDTIDWADQLCVSHICAKGNVESIESFGYGKGYVFEAEEFARMLHLLDDVIDVGVNVVLCAHAMIRKFEQPDEFGAYDRYELKIGTKTGARTAALVKEWCDMLLFANYKTIIVKDTNNKQKASGGQRIMYTTHHPAWDAKNRFGLPDEVPFTYESIAHCVPNIKTSIETSSNELVEGADVDAKKEEIISHPSIPQAVLDMLNQNNVNLNELRGAVALAGIYPVETEFEKYDPQFFDYLVTDWPKFLAKVNEYRKSMPFLLGGINYEYNK